MRFDDRLASRGDLRPKPGNLEIFARDLQARAAANP
jgi:hypothetical protein